MSYAVVQFAPRNKDVEGDIALVHQDWFVNLTKKMVRCPPNNWDKTALLWNKKKVSQFKWKAFECTVRKDMMETFMEAKAEETRLIDHRDTASEAEHNNKKLFKKKHPVHSISNLVVPDLSQGFQNGDLSQKYQGESDGFEELERDRNTFLAVAPDPFEELERNRSALLTPEPDDNVSISTTNVIQDNTNGDLNIIEAMTTPKQVTPAEQAASQEIHLINFHDLNKVNEGIDQLKVSMAPNKDIEANLKQIMTQMASMEAKVDMIICFFKNRPAESKLNGTETGPCFSPELPIKTLDELSSLDLKLQNDKEFNTNMHDYFNTRVNKGQAHIAYYGIVKNALNEILDFEIRKEFTWFGRNKKNLASAEEARCEKIGFVQFKGVLSFLLNLANSAINIDQKIKMADLNKAGQDYFRRITSKN